ncbi:hypothetical protein ACIBCA_14120 [Kitasatospora sp. NPDC051170]|uniref:hypothetical protein n=1 Tax=Kitasatospora sp. NPDC051170 TaxID=3364056 RepID=UPI0037B5B62D
MTASARHELDADELTDLLLRLLTDEGYRTALADRGARALARDEAELVCLSTIDQEELDFTARRFRSNLWNGDGGSGIAAGFPRSLPLLAEAGWPRERLLSAFLTSPAFEAYRALPHTGEGISLEEAFARFADGLTHGLADGAGAEALRHTLEHELLRALLTALVHEHPVSFRSDVEGIRRTDNGYAAVRRHPAEVVAAWGVAVDGPGPVGCLYSSTARGLAFGKVSERVVTAVEHPDDPASAQVLDALRIRGLW